MIQFVCLFVLFCKYDYLCNTAHTYMNTWTFELTFELNGKYNSSTIKIYHHIKHYVLYACISDQFNSYRCINLCIHNFIKSTGVFVRTIVIHHIIIICFGYFPVHRLVRQWIWLRVQDILNRSSAVSRLFLQFIFLNG